MRVEVLFYLISEVREGFTEKVTLEQRSEGDVRTAIGNIKEHSSQRTSPT